ncbi:MAG: hypothetical protein Q9170_000888 [Blastenia crenularia]
MRSLRPLHDEGETARKAAILLSSYSTSMYLRAREGHHGQNPQNKERYFDILRRCNSDIEALTELYHRQLTGKRFEQIEPVSNYNFAEAPTQNPMQSLPPHLQAEVPLNGQEYPTHMPLLNGPQTTVYSLPSTYATQQNPMTFEQHGQMQQNGQLYGQNIPQYALDGINGTAAHPAEQIGATEFMHECACGPGCHCTYCVVHPYNPCALANANELAGIRSSDSHASGTGEGLPPLQGPVNANGLADAIDNSGTGEGLLPVQGPGNVNGLTDTIDDSGTGEGPSPVQGPGNANGLADTIDNSGAEEGLLPVQGPVNVNGPADMIDLLGSEASFTPGRAFAYHPGDSLYFNYGPPFQSPPFQGPLYHGLPYQGPVYQSPHYQGSPYHGPHYQG